MPRFICSTLAIALAFAPLGRSSAVCDPSNTADFSIGDFDDGVTDLAVVGDNLFAAGPFTSAGPQRVGGVARWDVDHWTPIGPGQSRDVFALTAHRNTLAAAGVFDQDTMAPTLGVATWNAGRWTIIPGAPAIEQARLLSDADTLYVVGLYEAGQGLGPVVSWNGTAWTRYPVLKNAVTGAAVFQGSLYVCGFFGPGADDNAPSKIAKWDAGAWTSVNWEGVEVLSLATHNGALYAGTESASGNLLWQYDGTQWTAIPSSASSGAINRLVSTPGGLLAVGTFTTINEQPIAGVALWNGTSWQPYADGILSDAKCAAQWQGDLVVGGWLQISGRSRLNNIAWWNGARWSPFSASGNGINGRWPTATVHNGKLAAAAWSAGFGDAPGRGAASWDGTRWSSLNLDPATLVKRVESSGGSLYAAGYVNEGTSFLSYPLIERGSGGWDIASAELAGGAFDIAPTNTGIAVVGSMFSLTTGFGVQIAEFDGTNWSPLADSGDGYFEHILSWRGGLVVSGAFKTIDGVSANNIAFHSAGAWHPLGAGLDGQITALVSFQDQLYAAVAGDTADNGPDNAVVYRFDQGQWTPLHGAFGDQVLTMAAYDGHLYAGGSRYTTRGVNAQTLFRLENDAFVPLATQPDGEVSSLVVCDNGSSLSLFILGNFSFFGERPSVRIAEFNTCPCQADVNADQRINALDLSVMLARFGRRTDNAYEYGDLTGDRRVNSNDLSVLLQRFGNACE